MRTRFFPLLLMVAVAVSCHEKEDASSASAISSHTPEAPNPSLSVPPVIPSTSNSAAPVAEQLNTVALEVQELTFTSDVNNKEPVDVLLTAETGKRVWVHLRLRNRGENPRKIIVQFTVNGEKRTKVELQVDKSWSYRTWAYNTLRAGDKTGKVQVTVTDDEGVNLADTSLPIANKAQTKGYGKK